MKACEKLRELGFHSIRMLEVRQRPYDARVVELETLHLGLTNEEERRMNGSMADPQGDRQHYTREEKPQPPGKRPRPMGARTGKGGAEDGEEEREPRNAEEHAHQPAHARKLAKRTQNLPKSAVSGKYESYVARPLGQMKGHTAFLAFATRAHDRHHRPFAREEREREEEGKEEEEKKGKEAGKKANTAVAAAAPACAGAAEASC